MEIYWLEQAEAQVPAGDDWLSTWEAARLQLMRFPRRRADWRLGRWTAKRALASHLGLPVDARTLAAIEIRPTPSGAPQTFFANQPSALTISLSHRDGRAICAVAPGGSALGCDLEKIEERSSAFLADYFTAQEQALIGLASAEDRFRLATLVWSAKESALKALGVGLRLDTLCVAITPARVFEPAEYPWAWRPLEAHFPEGRTLHGWWQQTGVFLRTVAAAPPPGPPLRY
ncbi:MAG TPA: 4'-phosphopantetheinyl transferase superfamily protein [Bryobacteraceae bacterium]|nr:4'-phosphopantetheinyl transferase superfamily protein [Bryobacteraceae bacterium]